MKKRNSRPYLNLAVWMFLNIAIASWAVEVSPTGVYVLTDFGDTSTEKAAKEVLDKTVPDEGGSLDWVLIR